jgi:hypothetical protein
MSGSRSAASTAAAWLGREPLWWQCDRGPREIVPGSLAAGDFALVRRWIELNRQLLIDVWSGTVDAVAKEVYPSLQRLP